MSQFIATRRAVIRTLVCWNFRLFDDLNALATVVRHSPAVRQQSLQVLCMQCNAITRCTSVEYSIGYLTDIQMHIAYQRAQFWPRGLNNAETQRSSRPKWPRGQNFGLGLASNIWLGLASGCSRRTSSQEQIDGPICLHFTLPTTGHHTMIEDSYCARENEKYCPLIIMI